MWESSYWQRIKNYLERVSKIVELLQLILVIVGIVGGWLEINGEPGSHQKI